MPTRSALLVGAAALSLTMAAAPALAQEQVNQGNALDANQQVGTGGVNSATGQVDYSARNNLVTGNVGGGRAFQGTINYRAPGEFQGNLGSNSLFPFRANSLSSSPLISGSNDAFIRNQSSAGQGTVSVYRGFTSPTSTTGSAGRMVAFDGGAGGIVTVPRLNNTAPMSSFLGGAAAGRTQGIQADTLGQPIRTGTEPTSLITASPLLGLRVMQNPSPLAPPDLSPDTVNVNADDLNPAPNPEVAAPGTGQVSGLIEARSVGQPTTVPGALPGTTADAAPPGLIIGQQLQSMVMANRPFETTDQRVERLQSMIFDRNQSRVARPGNEVYQSLIAQMREGTEQPAAKPTTLDAGLSAPDEKKLDEAETKARDALREAYTIYGQPGEATTPPAEGDAAAQDEAMEALLRQLRANMPRVESLAGESAHQTNKLMQMAEERLAEGKYFDAEALYRQANITSPENPLTRVGLIHAQMGAGLIRSASFNLHKLFEEHPELINVRYEAGVLPPKERLRWLQGELQRMIDSQQYGHEPGIMLAYLGHQTESKQMVRYGLAVAEASAPRDALLKVLRGIWLETQAPAPAPAPAPEAKAAKAAAAPQPAAQPTPTQTPEQAPEDAPAK